MNPLHDIPIDRVAQRVVQPGINYETKVGETKYHSDAPMQLKNIDQTLRETPSFRDLRGRNNGILEVVGLADTENKRKNKSGLWIVKCRCGKYENRTAKAIKGWNYHEQKDRCAACWDLENVRLRAQAKALGFEFEEYCKKLREKTNDIPTS